MIEHPALETLHRMLCVHRLRAAFFANPTLCDRWRLGFGGEHRLTFHLVQAGCCTLQVDGGQDAVALEAGDLAVIAQRRAHVLSGDSTTLLCGAIDIECGERSLLLEALPSCILLRLRQREAQGSVSRLLELLGVETADQANACQLVLDKLAGALIAMVLRHYVCTDRPPHGLFAALNDPHLQPVLNAVHADVGRRWTLREVAAVANTSRSVFVEHFKRIFGLSFRSYLTRWRMSHAELMLRDTRRSVAQIADTLGYTTEASFRRAFKRYFGLGPGRMRRDGRAPANRQDDPHSAEAGRRVS